jgi:hypothetical protein
MGKKEEDIHPSIMVPSAPSKRSQDYSQAMFVVEVLADAASMSPPTPTVLSSEQHPSFDQQLLLQGLLQSNLLPETQRLLQQLQVLRQGEGGAFGDAFDAPLSRSSSGMASSKGVSVPNSGDGSMKQAASQVCSSDSFLLLGATAGSVSMC